MIEEFLALPIACPVLPARPGARATILASAAARYGCREFVKGLPYHLPAAHRTIALAAGTRGRILLPATCGGRGAIPGTPESRAISRAPRRASITAAIATRPRSSTAPRRAMSSYAFIATWSRAAWLSSPSAFDHQLACVLASAKASAPGQVQGFPHPGSQGRLVPPATSQPPDPRWLKPPPPFDYDLKTLLMTCTDLTV